MQHMLADTNVALVCLRQTRRGETGTFLAARGLINKDAVSLYDIGTAFPLYLYPSADELDAFSGRRPNISPEFLKAVAEKLNVLQEGPHGLPKGVTPEDIFNYMYAVLHSPTYRTRYLEFLKIDFPRLPLTADVKLFRALAALGAELTDLHLMKSLKLGDFLTTWPVKGDCVVEKVIYTDADQRVWVNATQYFGDVPRAVWGFQVGGYQVCEKWLKDRKGRVLEYADLQHYQKIIVALAETIRVMEGIDVAIEAHGGWPGAFV